MYVYSDCSLTESMDDESYLGQDRKGLYVCSIGGLPLFTSAKRMHSECSSRAVVFTDPCDPDHIRVEGNFFYCLRSGILVGEKSIQGRYKAYTKNIRFLPLDVVLPPESSPVQNNEMTFKSLSY